MTVQRFFLALALATGLPVAAAAQPCFDAAGLVPYGCPTAVNYLYRPQSNGQVILNDEKGKPLYRAVVVPGAKKKDLPLVGIADMSGREIVPPRFERVYAVGRNLAVGEAPLNPKDAAGSQRAFLIDLKTGEYRPTPWRRIITTLTADADGPPWLLGVLPHTRIHPYDVAILTPTGTDTGLRVDKFNPFSGVTKVLSLPYNLLGIDREIVNERGEDPFAGMEMVKVRGGLGYFVKRGPPPAEVKGPGAGPLLTPIGSDLRPQAHPADVIGMVEAGPWMWIIRRTPKGVRFYQHVGGKPILAAPPAGEAFLDLYVDKDGDVAVRTAAGWIDLYHRKPFPTAEAVIAARKAESKQFVAAVMAEENARVAAQARAEVDARAAQAAAAQAYREQVRGRIREAKAGRLTGLPLILLQRDVMTAGLEGEYESAGMTLSDDIRREICWQRQSVVCSSVAATSSSSGSSFVPTWEKAFENARALNQRQYQENCAAAAKGASRICTRY